jgi:hypothetical protein
VIEGFICAVIDDENDYDDVTAKADQYREKYGHRPCDFYLNGWPTYAAQLAAAMQQWADHQPQCEARWMNSTKWNRLNSCRLGQYSLKSRCRHLIAAAGNEAHSTTTEEVNGEQTIQQTEEN